MEQGGNDLARENGNKFASVATASSVSIWGRKATQGTETASGGTFVATSSRMLSPLWLILLALSPANLAGFIR